MHKNVSSLFTAAMESLCSHIEMSLSSTVDWSCPVSLHVTAYHTHTHTHVLRNRCLISVESTLSPQTLVLFLLPLNCPLYCTHPLARTGDACTQALTALHVNKPAPKCLTDTFEMTLSMWPVLALSSLLLLVVLLTLWGCGVGNTEERFMI